jgi:LmbE family N-acetylglucosaminyl deacetylase
MTEGAERVMVVTAHPDDPEFGAGGTIAKLVDEQRNAARVLGVERVEFLGYEDGEVEDTRSLRLDITRQIRRWRPDLIITQHPDRTYANFFGWHRDHRITASVAVDCVYPLARGHLSFPELLPDHEPHKVREVYLIQWEQPQLAVDITDTMDQKLQAVACHASQVSDWKSVEARVRARAATLGPPKGYTYAEGFDHVVLRA